MPDIVTDRGPQIRTSLFLTNAALCAAIGIWQVSSAVCVSCTGLLSTALPWVGLLFYGALTAVSRWRPQHRILSAALGLYIFVHACLVGESALQGRACPACITIASLALISAIVQCLGQSADRITLAAALGLGILSAFQHPFDRLEDLATRKLWPAKVLSLAPDFVDRELLTRCGHDAGVRVLVYEDERSCRSCSSVTRKIIPSLAQDFPSQICIHSNTISPVPKGQTLPVTVLFSKSMRLLVIEGLPEYSQLKSLIDRLLAENGGPAKSRP
jgi:hypothetical protein